MAVLTFSGERRALMSERNTHLLHPDLATLVSGSARTFASFSPTTPSLSILCRRFFPVINFLPSPSLATTWGGGEESITGCHGDKSTHVMGRVCSGGSCGVPALLLLLAGTCLSTRQSAGGLGWGLHLHSERLWQLSAFEALTWHTRLQLLCSSNDRAPEERDDKKKKEEERSGGLSGPFCVFSVRETQVKINYWSSSENAQSCGSPASAAPQSFGCTTNESSSQVINLFPAPFIHFRVELILKSFLCFRHPLPFSLLAFFSSCFSFLSCRPWALTPLPNLSFSTLFFNLI